MLPHPRTALLSVLGILGIFPFVTVAAPVDVAKRDDPLWGQATYFEQDGALGACGTYSQDSDYIVAISEDQYAATIYDPDDQMSWLCFQNVTIQNTDNGQYVQAMIVDSCPGCAYGSLDLSPVTFQALSFNNLDLGVLPITWNII
ncbi:MAG: hypothetical protein CYPHOPRED_005902 [Cyphobasidiales sp. Tagirdzhanova-0007]|nr:MAG: hypothetical protein CYPHOPRED_005902 [Cyphobasidiales sp. Tagirdzhanova-0007]